MPATPGNDVAVAAVLLSVVCVLGLSVVFALSYGLKQWLF